MLTSKEIIEKKKEYFFPNAMHFYKNPPHIIRGEGKYLFDDKGKRYLDFFAGVTVVNCGHCNKFINDRIKAQIDNLQHTSVIYLTEPMVVLAEMLSKVLPGGINKTFFCNSGTEANEGAMLLARLYTGKKGFISFEGGLHGRSALTMSVTGIPMWRIDPFLDSDVYIAKGFMKSYEDGKEIESSDGASKKSLEKVEEILKLHGSEIAACIVEPIQGNGGINVPAPDFFIKLKELLQKYDVLLIADEVQTAFGRTGKMFAVEHFGIVPDIITYAKALGNGQPIGAFSAGQKIAEAFNKPSASTLGGNPVSMTAGIAVLEFIERENLCQKSEALGEYFISKLKILQEKNLNILDVRGLGLMIGVEMKSAELVDEILEAMKDRGFIIGKNGMDRNVLAFQPSLIISKEDIDLLVANLGEVLIPFTDFSL